MLISWHLSVPSIRGKPLQSSRPCMTRISSPTFSPLNSGQATAILDEDLFRKVTMTFSPLNSGQATAMLQLALCSMCPPVFQSPQFGASHCNVLHKQASSLCPSIFQSPQFGASHCNRASVEKKNPMFRRIGRKRPFVVALSTSILSDATTQYT